jgi:hypothetical protein
MGVTDPHFLFYLIFINMNHKILVRKIMTEMVNEVEDRRYGLKYYAFDWDDNLMKMPTEIILKDEDGNEVGMSTEDFAEYRTEIGKNPFEYNGEMVVGFADDPFRFFRTEGDQKFMRDIENAPLVRGPWSDFVEAINSGSIFSIITARGHHPNTLKKGVYKLIMMGRGGLDKEQLVNSLKEYRKRMGLKPVDDENWLIKDYLDRCKFYPVSYGEGSATNPEEGKIRAMEEFVSYVKRLSLRLQKKEYQFINDVSNNFVPFTPMVGFSDDDIRNIESMKKHFDKKEDNILKTYHTKGEEKYMMEQLVNRMVKKIKSK